MNLSNADISPLPDLLDRLIRDWENEVVEFKQAGNDYSTDKIGQYFSALSNEANLRGLEKAWLIFGVNNKTRAVVSSDYRPDPERLQGTKMQMAENTEPSVTFRNIHELAHPNGRVVLFEIPAAPRGLPIAWKGHYYARAGESLTSLGLDKQDEIRLQTQAMDWSAQIVPTASIDDLEATALQKAREVYAKKYSNRFSVDEVMRWPLVTFLNRARVTVDGQITRAALLLLGKPESAYLLSPHPAQMTWKLDGPEKAYEHFGPPFLLNTTTLSLGQIMSLDRVQKRLPLSDDAIKLLRRDGLIEGRKPHIHVSASVAKATASKADYIRTRAQDDDFYCKLITDYLGKFGKASREEINKLLMKNLSDVLDHEQKSNKIGNLLTKLRRRGTIVNQGSKKSPSWGLAK